MSRLKPSTNKVPAMQDEKHGGKSRGIHKENRKGWKDNRHSAAAITKNRHLQHLPHDARPNWPICAS